MSDNEKKAPMADMGEADKTAYIVEAAAQFMARATRYADEDAARVSDLVRQVYLDMGMEGPCNLFLCIAQRLGQLRRGNNPAKLTLGTPSTDPATWDDQDRGEWAALRWVVDVSNDDRQTYCIPYCEQAMENPEMIGQLGSGLMRLSHEMMSADWVPYRVALIRSRSIVSGGYQGTEGPAIRAALDAFLAAADSDDSDPEQWVSAVEDAAREAILRMRAADGRAGPMDALLTFVTGVCHIVLDRISLGSGIPAPYGIKGAMAPDGPVVSAALFGLGNNAGAVAALAQGTLRFANALLEITLSDDAEALADLMRDYRDDPDRAVSELSEGVVGLASWLAITKDDDVTDGKRRKAEMN